MYEIYVKNKNDKFWNLAIEVPNEWGGMPFLWSYLEKKISTFLYTYKRRWHTYGLCYRGKRKR